MDAKFASAAAAYANAARGLKVPGAAGGDTAGASGAGGFADMVQDVVGRTVDSSRASERMSLGAISGTASLHEVVTSVSAAEVSLQTVVAIRDRVIGAYQEIMRMPI